MNTQEAIQKCILIAGGVKELAHKVGVTYRSVVDWKNGRTGVSISNCLKIEKAVEGKVTREEILPSHNWSNFIFEDKKDDNKQLEIVKKLLERGMDKEAIVDVTGVSMEEIEKIQAKKTNN